jgi:hypothetical protein
MNVKCAAAVLALLLPVTPLLASADQNIGARDNAIQQAINQQMVRNGIQNSLQNQLQQQQNALQIQQQLLQLQTQNNLTEGTTTLQRLQVQQQILLLQAELRSMKSSKKKPKH